MLRAFSNLSRRAGRGCARSLLLIITLVLVGSPADAQRPDARNMSCAQARALVQSRGAVVISTGQHIYDRFVASANFCVWGERLEPAWIGTGEGARCQVGFLCRAPFPRPNR